MQRKITHVYTQIQLYSCIVLYTSILNINTLRIRLNKMCRDSVNNPFDYWFVGQTETIVSSYIYIACSICTHRLITKKKTHTIQFHVHRILSHKLSKSATSWRHVEHSAYSVVAQQHTQSEISAQTNDWMCLHWLRACSRVISLFNLPPTKRQCGTK